VTFPQGSEVAGDLLEVMTTTTSYGYHGLYVQSSGTSWASGFGIS
jgi:hypothetical protein